MGVIMNDATPANNARNSPLAAIHNLPAHSFPISSVRSFDSRASSSRAAEFNGPPGLWFIGYSRASPSSQPLDRPKALQRRQWEHEISTFQGRNAFEERSEMPGQDQQVIRFLGKQ